MAVPDFYVQRPPGPDSDAGTSFEELWREHLELGDLELDYLLLHGSGSSEIAEFEPRQSNDTAEFGNRTAVYAASDGLWAMYFALVDRRQGSSLVNGTLHVLTDDGHRAGE